MQVKVDVLKARKMGKGNDLSDFDKGQNVMIRQLGQCISKTKIGPRKESW